MKVKVFLNIKYGQLKKKRFEQPEKLFRRVGGLKTAQKYFVLLSTEQAHQGHPVGQAASFCQRIYPLILNKISELVSWGIDETKEV